VSITDNSVTLQALFSAVMWYEGNEEKVAFEAYRKTPIEGAEVMQFGRLGLFHMRAVATGKVLSPDKAEKPCINSKSADSYIMETWTSQVKL